MKKLILIIIIFSTTLIGFGQTAIFSSNFEDQNTSPEIGGSALLENSNGGFTVVPNPHADDRNSSSYVLKVSTSTGTGGRAEYTAGRYVTNEKKYIYTWKRFHPTGMFTDIDLIGGSIIINQWKTWPCEYYGSGIYDFQDEICYGGGIFNDMRYSEPNIIDYLSRAAPNCKVDFGIMSTGSWNTFVLEMYWTQTNEGYYRIWRNDTLFGYSDNIRTLMDGFIEGTCDMNWATGLYTYWEKTGGMSQDSLSAYIDDIKLYDEANGYTINDICPDCESAPVTTVDSSEYKINFQGYYADDGYNNVLISWRGDTAVQDLANTFGQSNGIDFYLWNLTNGGSNGSYDDECFPDEVINTYLYWTDTKTHQIYLKDLTPANNYTFRLLGASPFSGAKLGTQLWTTEENRDTVFAASNTCDMAELTNLVSDVNGDLTINVKSIGSTAYLNSIEIVEYTVNHNTSIKNTKSNELNIFPNPVNDILFVKGETVPSSITIYSCDGRKVKYAENTNVVNISDLKKGIYIVLINMQESVVTSKIIKE